MGEKVERLVNLTVALLETRRPLTFHELKARTGYYGQDDAQSARRMFERDKDALRELGVPIETRPLDAFEAELGYAIDRRRYELPDVDLTSDEVAALAVALRAVGDAGSRLALTKVAARAPDPPPDLHEPDVPRVDLDVDPVDPLAAAVVDRRPLRFAYRAASGEASERTLEPYAVASRRGAWYVVGRDRARDAIRAFRLDRIDGAVEPAGAPGSFEIPADLDVGTHLEGQAEDVDASIAVAPELAWEAELRGGAPTGEEVDGLRVHRFVRANPWRTRAWAVGHGPDVRVLEPEALRDDVIRALRAVAEGPT